MKFEDMNPKMMNIIDDGTIPKKDVFAMQIDGWQFEPFLYNGDYLLFVKQDDIAIGQLGAYLKDGQLFFKQKGLGVLRSVDPGKPDEPLTDEWQCVGRFHGKVQPVSKYSS